MAEPRFGEGFPEHFDGTNRLTPYKEQQGQLPREVQFSGLIREALREALEEEGWPECPNVSNVEEFFNAAKEAVNISWERRVQPLLGEACENWATALEGDDLDVVETQEILRNPAALEEKLRMQQFGVLEGELRKQVPEAWRSLVLASSERQLAAVAVSREWLRNMEPTEAKKLGMTKPEMQIFLDLAGIFGKYIDSAYVRQIELADTPGGSAETPLKEKKGSKYLYDIQRPDREEIEVKNYPDVFPFEWSHMTPRFTELAQRIREDSRTGVLPEHYLRFAEHLDLMAEVYGSTNTDPERLHAEWEALMISTQELNQTEVPIMIIPQATPAVAGDANKTDVEIRLGIRTPETEAYGPTARYIESTAQSILDTMQTALTERRQVPKLILNIQPFAFGPNLYWFTRGESDQQKIFSHTDAIRDVARKSELPCLKKLLGKTFDDRVYMDASVMATMLHEVGHFVPTDEDDRVLAHVGKSGPPRFIEEFKAWTMGARIMSQTDPQEPALANFERETVFFAIFGVHLDYLKNKSPREGKSGEQYYLCAVECIDQLIKNAVLQKEESGYTITDPEKGLQVIAEVGERISQLYTAEESTPADALAYLAEVRQKKSDPQIREIAQILKAA